MKLKIIMLAAIIAPNLSSFTLSKISQSIKEEVLVVGEFNMQGITSNIREFISTIEYIL